MKKTVTTATKRSKLALNTETVRTLTSHDLDLVVGGACQHGSVMSNTVGKNVFNGGPNGIPRPDIPTCG